MCGIAGIVDYSGGAGAGRTIAAMSGALSLRCPGGGGGEFICGEAAFAQRYSSACYAQPLTLRLGGETYTIVFDGELYNANVLSEQLPRGSFTYGGGDAELMLRAFAELGAGCLDGAEGVFAFAVWRHGARELFAARDRMGVKPFFFRLTAGGLAFASELKALLQSPDVPRTVGRDALRQLLLLGPGRRCGEGIIGGAEELLPGEFLRLTREKFTRTRYYRFRASPHRENEGETAERTRQLIEQAVKSRLSADAPPACFLSGGLDSGIITHVAAREYAKRGERLTTYSLDFEGNDRHFAADKFTPDRDGKYIDLMRAAADTEHTFVTLSGKEAAAALGEAALARDIPGMAEVDSSLLLLSRLVSGRHKVCLSGECADEIFGGYPWLFDDVKLQADGFPWAPDIELRARLFRAEYTGTDPRGFVRECAGATLRETDYLDSDSPEDRRMREMFMLSYMWFMQTLLGRNDRMTAYGGLNVRVPFCDRELCEYAFNMPWRIKSLGGREKGIVREAFSELLPEEIVWRKKSPFPKPHDPALISLAAAELKRRLSRPGSVLREVADAELLGGLLSDSAELPAPWYGQLMRKAQLFTYLSQLDDMFERWNLDIAS